MQGIMTAKHTGTAADMAAAEAFILEKIEKVVNSDAVYVKDVVHSMYVGDRASWPPPALRPVAQQKSVSLKTLGWTVFGAVIVAVATTSLLLLLARRRFKRYHFEKENETLSASRSIEISEIELDMRFSARHDGKDDIVEDTSTPDDIANRGNVQPNIIDPSQAQSEVIALVDQPPLPSQRRKRRRKKKKKKKKNVMTLTRSNSLNSMDTIAEEQEEEDASDGESECGSEYSTDDEDNHPSDQLVRSASTGEMPSAPLEQVVESPRIRKLPPPWI